MLLMQKWKNMIVHLVDVSASLARNCSSLRIDELVLLEGKNGEDKDTNDGVEHIEDAWAIASWRYDVPDTKTPSRNLVKLLKKAQMRGIELLAIDAVCCRGVENDLGSLDREQWMEFMGYFKTRPVLACYSRMSDLMRGWIMLEVQAFEERKEMKLIDFLPVSRWQLALNPFGLRKLKRDLEKYGIGLTSSSHSQSLKTCLFLFNLIERMFYIVGFAIGAIFVGIYVGLSFLNINNKHEVRAHAAEFMVEIGEKARELGQLFSYIFGLNTMATLMMLEAANWHCFHVALASTYYAKVELMENGVPSQYCGDYVYLYLSQLLKDFTGDKSFRENCQGDFIAALQNGKHVPIDLLRKGRSTCSRCFLRTFIILEMVVKVIDQCGETHPFASNRDGFLATPVSKIRDMSRFMKMLDDGLELPVLKTHTNNLGLIYDLGPLNLPGFVLHILRQEKYVVLSSKDCQDFFVTSPSSAASIGPLSDATDLELTPAMTSSGIHQHKESSLQDLKTSTLSNIEKLSRDIVNCTCCCNDISHAV